MSPTAVFASGWSPTRADFLATLTDALPKGKLWPRATDTNLAALLDILGSELLELFDEAETFVLEANPRTTQALVPEWEESVGLPDPCAGGPLLLLTRRRAAVVQRLAVPPGTTIAALEEEARRAGYEVQIQNAVGFDAVDGNAESYCGDELWAVSFWVFAPEVTWTPLTFGCGFGEPWAEWGNDLLECVIRRTAPADRWPFFSYTLPGQPGAWPDAVVQPGGVAVDGPELLFKPDP